MIQPSSSNRIKSPASCINNCNYLVTQVHPQSSKVTPKWLLRQNCISGFQHFYQFKLNSKLWREKKAKLKMSSNVYVLIRPRVFLWAAMMEKCKCFLPESEAILSADKIQNRHLRNYRDRILLARISSWVKSSF